MIKKIAVTFIAIISIFTLPALSFAAGNGTPTAPNSGGTTPNTSFNWSGYVAGTGTFTSVTGTWNVPTVANGTSTMADATWIGIGGINSKDLIQAGTQAIVNSTNGSGVAYEAWFETLPQTTQALPLTISAGDSVTATLTQTSQNEWQISFRDNTTGQSYTNSLPYDSSLSSAEWIEEMPTTDNNVFVPLDNFGTVSFTGGSTVQNGNTVTIAQSGAQSLTMVNPQGQTLSAPSAINSDGESFMVTRSSASAASSVGIGRGYQGMGRGWRRTGVGVQGYTPRTRPTSTSTSVTTPTITITRSSGGGWSGFTFPTVSGQGSQIFRMFFRNFGGFNTSNLTNLMNRLYLNQFQRP